MDIAIHYRSGDSVRGECLPADCYGPTTRLIKIAQSTGRNSIAIFLDTEFATELRKALDALYPVVEGKVTPLEPSDPLAATAAYADEHIAEFAPPAERPTLRFALFGSDFECPGCHRTKLATTDGYCPSCGARLFPADCYVTRPPEHSMDDPAQPSLAGGINPDVLANKQ